MGACDFYTYGKGKTVQEAFNAARKTAQYDYGHAGYTGTVAEKGNVVVIGVGIVDRNKAEQLAESLVHGRDPRVSDKWGPAGAIQIAKNEWLFFGMASS